MHFTHLSLHLSSEAAPLAAPTSIAVGTQKLYTKNMAATTTTVPTTRYDMTLVGRPTTAAATAKALADGGPLLIAQDHVLAKMLPDALDRISHAPQVMIKTSDLHGTFVGGLLFEPAITTQGMHMSVVHRRWTVLLQDLDNAGFAFDPVHGNMKTAWPTTF